MSIEDAIKNITAFVYVYAEIIPSQVAKALDVLKDAAKKQIPRKFIKGRTTAERLCPTCGKTVNWIGYPCRCGQMIDWSEVE